MLFRPEHRSCLKHPVINAHHGLLIKLWALSQLCLFVEIVQLEHVGTAFCPPGHDLGRVYLRKALAEQVIPEPPYDSLLDFEFCPLPDIAQGNGSESQLCLQGGVKFPFVHRDRHGVRWAGQDFYVLHTDFKSMGRPFLLPHGSLYLCRALFL